MLWHAALRSHQRERHQERLEHVFGRMSDLASKLPEKPLKVKCTQLVHREWFRGLMFKQNCKDSIRYMHSLVFLFPPTLLPESK
jgi:hypothetical protein